MIHFLAAALASLPVPIDPVMWVSNDDYPLEAIRFGQQGSTGIRIIADREGAPTSCVVVFSSGSQRLDGVSCDVVAKRGHFLPAKDRKGQAVAGAVRRNIIWRLPDTIDPIIPAPADFTLNSPKATPLAAGRSWSFAVEVDAKGKNRNCRAMNEDVPAAASRSVCRQFKRRWRIDPLRDDRGNPIPSVQSISVDVAAKAAADGS
jgi:hypothetical protein